MASVEELHIAESTALLEGSPSSVKRQGHYASVWYWPWQPKYWAAIPVIFMAGFAVAPTASLSAPFLKMLFCERGLPTLFPINNGTDSVNSGQNLYFIDSPNNDDGHCDSAEYSAAIARFYSTGSSLAAVMVMLTVRFWSGLSDRIGRQRTLLIWAIGATIANLLPVIVYRNKWMSLYVLWLGSIIEGASGSILSVIALTHAYAADVTRPEERTLVFGQIIAGLHAGLGLGSVAAGVVAKHFGLYAVFFWMVPAIYTFDICYVLLIPESLSIAALKQNNLQEAALQHSSTEDTLVHVEDPPGAQPCSSEDQHKDTASYAHRLKVFITGVLPQHSHNRLAGKYSLVTLMIVCFLMLAAVLGVTTQISTYLLYRFHWPIEKMSYVTAIQGLSRLVSLTLLLPMVKRFSPQHSIPNPMSSIKFDLKVAVLGLLLESLTMLIYCVATIGELFYLAGITGAIGTLFFPAIRGIVSQSVSPDKVGKTMGTLATFESVAAVLAPVLFGTVYSNTLEVWPTAIFYIAFALALSAMMLAFAVLVQQTRAMQHSNL
ncbi:hypothetical protein BGZ72_009824 [Mortierella alpina]|nr:hypothetical protein BGZ72_009824 [Mortierella alpina]